MINSVLRLIRRYPNLFIGFCGIFLVVAPATIPLAICINLLFLQGSNEIANSVLQPVANMLNSTIFGILMMAIQMCGVLAIVAALLLAVVRRRPTHV